MSLTIRALCPDDAPAMADLSTQPKVVWGTLQLPAQTTDQWRKRLESNDPFTSYHLAAVIDGKLVGNAGLHWANRPRIRHVGHFGIMVHDDYQGQGVGKALTAAVLEAADRWLDLARIELEVFSDNEPAIHLYKRFGFEIEGRKRKDFFRDGQYVDSLIMGRLRPGL